MTDRIIIDPKILVGKPVIKGTRISVEFIIGLLSSGMRTEEILKEYPELEKEDILAALEYAVCVLRNEEVFSATEIA